MNERKKGDCLVNVNNCDWDMCIVLSEIINHTEQSTPLFVVIIYILYIQGVPGGMCNTSGGCSLCQTIPI